MSEQQSLETARANTREMNAHSREAYADTFAEDAIWEDDALPAPVRGRAAAAETMAVFYSAFPDMRFEVEREFSSGDSVAVCWRVTGTHQGDFAGIPATGRKVDYHACGIFQIREGRIAYVRTYLDTGTIMRQLGVSPESGA